MRGKSTQSHQYSQRFRYFALVLICTLFCSTGYAQSSCSPKILTTHIAQALHDDHTIPIKNWTPVDQFPNLARSHWNDYQGSVWYKIRWQYSCDLNQNLPLAFVISYMNMAAKVYLNNELLWKDLSLVEPLSRSWNTPYIWHLPASTLKKGENIFLIYVASSASQRVGLGEIHLGTVDQVLPFYEKYYLEQRTLTLVSFVVTAVIFILYFMVWLIYPKDQAYLWISITLAIWLCCNLLLLVQNINLNSDEIERIISWLFFTYSIVNCFTLWRFAKLSFPRIEKLLIILFLSISLVLIFIPSIYLYETVSLIFLINFILFILLNSSYPFLIYKSKKIELYMMAAMHFLYIPIGIHDAYQIIINKNEFWSHYATPLNIILLGILLGLKLYRNNKVIESFNQVLIDKVNTVTHDLSESLNKQHQLALDNIRLQERIQLSHDLHDGLGGSLVRSMVLVDQSQNMNKAHFLSILKLLRSDLRQVIDSGSSLGVQLPQSPIIWAAGIRRRFVDLFEELNIESKWELANEWLNLPTNLQCLTLSRVAEEALTNVIKHSQASAVKVILKQTECNLILEICDNGIGFNPETVDRGLHVGLQSMQARVQRINGDFEVESKPNWTIIRVTLQSNC